VTPAATGHAIKTVFVILMENHNWSSIKGSRSAPYINTTLLPLASHAEQYYNPPGIHPSLPNYLWLEAGANFGIRDDKQPSANHQRTPNHLVTLLNAAGISWKSYQEDIDGSRCPITGTRLYAPKHNPMVYFDDVTGANRATSAFCIAHIRPYTELATDLRQNRVARYNFITPNLCDDMHNARGCVTSDSIKNGDTWLANEVPRILDSQAYKRGGAIFITWDEGEGSDGPIGMIVLSPHAKGKGYTNTLRYTHSATLRTLQEIFGVTPLLGDAAKAPDLADLFQVFP
jgi:phospholipase C